MSQSETADTKGNTENNYPEQVGAYVKVKEDLRERGGKLKPKRLVYEKNDGRTLKLWFVSTSYSVESSPGPFGKNGIPTSDSFVNAESAWTHMKDKMRGTVNAPSEVGEWTLTRNALSLIWQADGYRKETWDDIMVEVTTSTDEPVVRVADGRGEGHNMVSQEIATEGCVENAVFEAIEWMAQHDPEEVTLSE